MVENPESEVKPTVVGESEGPIIAESPEPKTQVPLGPQEPSGQAKS